jgi:hypothetical protein
MADKKETAKSTARRHAPERAETVTRRERAVEEAPGEVKQVAGAHKVRRRIKWADDLIRELERSGTGTDKTDIIRRAKAEKFNRMAQEKYGGTKTKDLDDKDPELHLSAEEAVRILEDDDKVGEVTRDKARTLLEEGYWEPKGGPVAPPPDADVPAPPDAEPEPMEDDDDPAKDNDQPGTEQPGDPNRFPGPKEHGKPGDPGTGERPLDRAPAPASADTAGLGRGTDPGLPPAPRPGMAESLGEEEDEKKGKGKKK